MKIKASCFRDTVTGIRTLDEIQKYISLYIIGVILAPYNIVYF